MLVKELISFLQRCEQDAVVLYRCCSDYSVLEGEDIKQQSVRDPLKSGESAILHHNMPGEYRRYGAWEYKNQPLPDSIDAVILPGN